MLETPEQEMHPYRGVDTRTNETTLAPGVFVRSSGVIPFRGSVMRATGKVRLEDLGGPVLGLASLGNTKFIAQVGSEIHIIDL